MDSLVFESLDGSAVRIPECSSVKDSPKYLPLDLVSEILNRTPWLATLDACKMVCKDWNELLHSPEFMPSYCHNTKNLCGFILQGNLMTNQEFVSLAATQMDDLGRCITSDRTFSGMDSYVKILASSSKQGILFAAGIGQSKNERMVFIGKPSIEFWVALPLPNFRYRTATAAVVVRSKPFRYKIIRISQRNDHKRQENCYHCEVFDSKTWEWETLRDIKLGYQVYLDVSAGQPVTVGNLVHWLTTDHQVLAYDCEDDSCHQFPLPEIGSDDHGWRSLVEYEGKLALMYTKKKEEITQVWVWTGGVWRMLTEFELEPSLKREEARPVGLYNRDIVVLTAPEKVVFYNLRDSVILRSLKTSTHGVEQSIFPFRSDCEKVNLLRSGDDIF